MTIKRPILAITMGDPAGIGPEIAVKTFSVKEIYNSCSPLLIGNAEIIRQALKITKHDLKIRMIHQVSEAKFEYGTIDIYELPVENPEKIKYGVISKIAGDIAFRSVVKAIELANSGEVDGTVTCPINKKAMNEAGHHFSGHTEIYAHYTNTPKYAMLLADDKIKVIHVSTHVSLRQACDLVKKDRILDVISIMDKGLRKLGIADPRIGVAGLNPHSGDEGLFGDEEITEITPAVTEAKKLGFNVQGPVPPDTLFALANGGRFDGCVAMYHDQGHIPFKFSGFEWDEKKGVMKSVKGVNITLGLPIVRTSVDHGTAFEVAGKGVASPDALLCAIDYAVKLCSN